jgi:hypothetical protein
MRRLLCARYVLVMGANEAIPAWFQNTAVSENITEDTPSATFASVFLRIIASLLLRIIICASVLLRQVLNPGSMFVNN